MKFNPPLQAATLIRRYKRFLADIEQQQQQWTIHCANTGAMTGCAETGSQVWYSTSDNPKRKYPHSWQLTQTKQQHWICVNTALANSIVQQAIEQQQIATLTGYSTLRTEVKYGDENSRIDILLQAEDKPDCYIEVKSVTLMSDTSPGQGYFPDAVTVRGQKHLRELTRLASSGKRAVLLFLVQHTGIEKVATAQHIDAKYSQLLQIAVEQGVEIIAISTNINAQQITIGTVLPFEVIASN